MDVGVVCDSVNENIKEAIEFAKSKGIVCEIVDSAEKVRGAIFICYMDPKICYSVYFIYYPYICLAFGNTKCNKFVYYRMLGLKEDGTFNMLKKDTIAMVKNKPYKLWNIYPGQEHIAGCAWCDDAMVEIDHVEPDKEMCDMYNNFFNNNYKNEYGRTQTD